MATFYLKSTGSNTAPYDTEAKAATSMWSIRAHSGFAATDTIILCDDVTDTTFVTDDSAQLCNIEAKAGLATKPVYYYNTGGTGPFYTGAETFAISDIEFKHDNTAAPFLNVSANITFNDCDMIMEDHTLNIGTYNRCLIIIKASNSASSSFFQDALLDKCTFIDERTAGAGQLAVFATEAGTGITNSVIYDNATGADGNALIYTENATGVANIHNNVYYSANDNEFVYNSDTSLVDNGVDNVEGDPLFVDYASGDYMVAFASPAVGQSTAGGTVGSEGRVAGTSTVGTAGDFATIDAYKTSGVVDGDTLNIISDIDDSASTQGFGNFDNITITSALSTKPVITASVKTLWFGSENAPGTATNLNITIENIEVDVTTDNDDDARGCITLHTTDASGLVINNNTIKNSIATVDLGMVTIPSVTAMDDLTITNNEFVIGATSVSSALFNFASSVFDGAFTISNNEIVSNAVAQPAAVIVNAASHTNLTMNDNTFTFSEDVTGDLVWLSNAVDVTLASFTGNTLVADFNGGTFDMDTGDNVSETTNDGVEHIDEDEETDSYSAKGRRGSLVDSAKMGSNGYLAGGIFNSNTGLF